jgi:putative transposase
MDTQSGAKGGETPPLQVLPSLGQIVAYFKYHSAKQINLQKQTPGAPFWQRGYYEHVIRDDESLNRIREYIATNPRRWAMDRENPHTKGKMNLIHGWGL